MPCQQASNFIVSRCPSLKVYTHIKPKNQCEWGSRPMYPFVWWSAAQKTQKVLESCQNSLNFPFTLLLISFHRLSVRDVGWVSIIHCLLIVFFAFKCQTVPYEGMQVILRTVGHRQTQQCIVLHCHCYTAKSFRHHIEEDEEIKDSW